MADVYTNAFSDNIRIAKSKAFTEPDDGTYNWLRLPRWTLLLEVKVWITTAYGDVAATMTVGFANYGAVSDDADAFMKTAECDPDAAGMKSSLDDATGDYAAGYYFSDAPASLTVTVDDNAGTVGSFHLFAVYSVIH